MSAVQETPATKNENPPRLGTKIFAFLASILAAFIGGLFSGPTVQTWVCQSVPVMGDHISAVCGQDFKSITISDAEKALMHYYSLAGGAEPQRAWKGMLTNEEQDRVKLPDYEERWAPYSWAEVVSTPKKVEGRFNVL